MIRTTPRQARLATTPRPARAVDAPGGFSMVEAVISILLVGILLVAAMNTVAASRVSQRVVTDREHGIHLAQQLMTEILQMPYMEPGANTDSLGLDASESNRTDFDDVDDYKNWLRQPPENPDGTVVPGSAGYRRTVGVYWVVPTNLDQLSGTSTGVKTIRVTVFKGNRRGADVTTIRTDAWVEAAQASAMGTVN